MDMDERFYEVDIDGQELCIGAMLFGHALRKLADLRLSEFSMITIRRRTGETK